MPLARSWRGRWRRVSCGLMSLCIPARSTANWPCALPVPLTRQLVERGQERFDIYCSPCHDRAGSGQGIVVRRGFRRPSSFHIDRLREAPIGYFFDVMTNGFGAMMDYAVQITPHDRWAIAAYIRALQLSQYATLDDVPSEERQRLQELTP